MKYKVGTKIICQGIKGKIIPNFKLPDDICVEWENGMTSSYDEEWLEEYTIIIEE
jgi:hypothetical protein